MRLQLSHLKNLCQCFGSGRDVDDGYVTDVRSRVAVLFWLSRYFRFLLLLSVIFTSATHTKGGYSPKHHLEDIAQGNAGVFYLRHGLIFGVQFRRVDCGSKVKLSFPLIRETRRGQLCLSLPSKAFVVDITIYTIYTRPGDSYKLRNL